MKKLVPSFLLFFCILFAFGQHTPLSPYDFGLDTAKTGIGRYYVLYNTHKAAVEQGVDVDYYGIGELDIEIPADVKPIPLTQYNSFHQLVLNVTNNSKGCFLFERIIPTDSITIPKELIDKGDFRSIPQLRNGQYILILEDQTPWVDNRSGYKYGHNRKDILLIKNGIASNKPVMPYNTPETKVVATYCKASSVPTVVSGLSFIRTKESTFRTYAFDIQNIANLVLCDIEIVTPPTDLVADVAIRVYNVADFQCDYVRINGTYSRTDYSGYGLCLDNVWKSRFSHLWGHANWGIFGTNNMNDVEIEYSDINRFDIHCYGRDVTMKNCTFSNLYHQFSSMYGTLKFEDCIFDNEIPVLLESTYNAYTPFELVFDRCLFYVTKTCNFLVDARMLTTTVNSRPEVALKCLPNIKMTNSTIHLSESVDNYYMFHFKSVEYKEKVGYVENLDIQDLIVQGGKVKMKIANKSFPHENSIQFPLNNETLGY